MKKLFIILMVLFSIQLFGFEGKWFFDSENRTEILIFKHGIVSIESEGEFIRCGRYRILGKIENGQVLEFFIFQDVFCIQFYDSDFIESGAGIMYLYHKTPDRVPIRVDKIPIKFNLVRMRPE